MMTYIRKLTKHSLLGLCHCVGDNVPGMFTQSGRACVAHLQAAIDSLISANAQTNCQGQHAMFRGMDIGNLHVRIIILNDTETADAIVEEIEYRLNAGEITQGDKEILLFACDQRANSSSDPTMTAVLTRIREMLTTRIAEETPEERDKRLTKNAIDAINAPDRDTMVEGERALESLGDRAIPTLIEVASQKTGRWVYLLDMVKRIGTPQAVAALRELAASDSQAAGMATDLLRDMDG